MKHILLKVLTSTHKLPLHDKTAYHTSAIICNHGHEHSANNEDAGIFCSTVLQLHCVLSGSVCGPLNFSRTTTTILIVCWLLMLKQLSNSQFAQCTHNDLPDMISVYDETFRSTVYSRSDNNKFNKPWRV